MAVGQFEMIPALFSGLCSGSLVEKSQEVIKSPQVDIDCSRSVGKRTGLARLSLLD